MPTVTLWNWGLEAGVWHPSSASCVCTASSITYLFSLGAWKSLEKEVEKEQQ